MNNEVRRPLVYLIATELPRGIIIFILHPCNTILNGSLLSFLDIDFCFDLCLVQEKMLRFLVRVQIKRFTGFSLRGRTSDNIILNVFNKSKFI